MPIYDTNTASAIRVLSSTPYTAFVSSEGNLDKAVFGSKSLAFPDAQSAYNTLIEALDVPTVLTCGDSTRMDIGSGPGRNLQKLSIENNTYVLALDTEPVLSDLNTSLWDTAYPLITVPLDSSPTQVAESIVQYFQTHPILSITVTNVGNKVTFHRTGVANQIYNPVDAQWLVIASPREGYINTPDYPLYRLHVGVGDWIVNITDMGDWPKQIYISGDGTAFSKLTINGAGYNGVNGSDACVVYGTQVETTSIFEYGSTGVYKEFQIQTSVMNAFGLEMSEPGVLVQEMGLTLLQGDRVVATVDANNVCTGVPNSLEIVTPDGNVFVDGPYTTVEWMAGNVICYLPKTVDDGVNGSVFYDLAAELYVTVTVNKPGLDYAGPGRDGSPGRNIEVIDLFGKSLYLKTVINGGSGGSGGAAFTTTWDSSSGGSGGNGGDGGNLTATGCYGELTAGSGGGAGDFGGGDANYYYFYGRSGNGGTLTATNCTGNLKAGDGGPASVYGSDSGAFNCSCCSGVFTCGSNSTVAYTQFGQAGRILDQIFVDCEGPIHGGYITYGGQGAVIYATFHNGDITGYVVDIGSGAFPIVEAVGCKGALSSWILSIKGCMVTSMAYVSLFDKTIADTDCILDENGSSTRTDGTYPSSNILNIL